MSNRSLYLHIGHHKTGTGTLQRRIFPRLTSVAYLSKETRAAMAFKGAFSKPPDIWWQRGQEIFAPLMAELDERGAGGAALISHEGMSAPRIFASSGWKLIRVPRHPTHLAAHLRGCRMAAARAGFTDVKVIMGVRRQDQYLASRYAQHGRLADQPGQADFERQTLEIIDPAKRYSIDGVWIDYKMTRDLFVNALGVDSVLVLPLEQLGADRLDYFAALGRFLGEATAANGEVEHRVNVRSVAPDVWRCNLASRRWSLTACERVIEIRLGPELKSKILAAYEEANRRLANDIEIDLAQYGYC